MPFAPVWLLLHWSNHASEKRRRAPACLSFFFSVNAKMAENTLQQDVTTEEDVTLEQHDILVYCRFRPFIKSELLEDVDRKAQCSVAFHKLGKKVLLKV